MARELSSDTIQQDPDAWSLGERVFGSRIIVGTGNDLDLKPGMCLEFCFLDAATTLPAVSGTVKNIDVSGTEDDTLDVLLLLG